MDGLIYNGGPPDGRSAEVAELADALDSKSSGANTSCGFDPRLRHSHHLALGRVQSSGDRLGRSHGPNLGQSTRQSTYNTPVEDTEAVSPRRRYVEALIAALPSCDPLVLRVRTVMAVPVTLPTVS